MPGIENGGASKTYSNLPETGSAPPLGERNQNTAPRFEPFGDVIIAEGVASELPVRITDPDAPSQRITVLLPPGSPEGLEWDPLSRVLRWTPGEADGPGEVRLQIQAEDDGRPPQRAIAELLVQVMEMNQVPELAAVDPQVAYVGREWTLAPTARDRDLPEQALVYRVTEEAPSRLQVDETTGRMTWTPDPSDPGASFRITLEVTDTGVPALTARQSILLEVRDDGGCR